MVGEEMMLGGGGGGYLRGTAPRHYLILPIVLWCLTKKLSRLEW
jgi:hypothetical protein